MAVKIQKEVLIPEPAEAHTEPAETHTELNNPAVEQLRQVLAYIIITHFRIFNVRTFLEIMH